MYESGKVAGGMNRDELIKYLKNNLDIRVEISKGVRSEQVLCVKLLLEDHLISITAVPIKDTKR